MDFTLMDQIHPISFFSPLQGFYYRPLTMLTFMWDKYIWNLEPTFMLLENVFIHLLNTLLVFFLARRIFSGNKDMLLPILSGLLFAAHPLATESINWISGRTDPLATFFILLSTLSVFKAMDKKQPFYLLIGSFFALSAVLAKEMSLFFIPACCLLIYLWPRMEEGDVTFQAGALKDCLIFASLFLLAIAVFLVYRHIHFHGACKGLDVLTSRINGHWDDTLLNALTILGFYLKKIFVPIPLSFAITEVNPAYLWLGIMAIPACFMLIMGRKLYFLCLLTGSLLIGPAIILGTVKIAWTPFAERYVYMAYPFFVIGFIGILSRLFHSDPFKTGVVAFTIFLAAASVTIHRNIISRDNLVFYQDTVEKNPHFSLIRNELAIALLNKGRTDEAERQLKKGIALIRPDDGQRPQILFANLAYLKLNQNKISEAEKIINKVIHREKDKTSKDILWVYIQLIKSKLTKEKFDSPYRKILLADMINTYDELYKKTGKADYLYMAGKKALILGYKKVAAGYFSKAAGKLLDTSPYKTAALTLAKNIKSD